MALTPRVSFQHVLPVLCVLVTALNLWSLGYIRWEKKPGGVPMRNAADKTYTQIGDDHPDYLVFPSDLPTVALDVQTSPAHYGVGTPEAYDAWDWITEEHNWYKLGPTKHAYTPVMAHDLHCLKTFHDAMFAKTLKGGHIQHCLQYLRQVILCDPDLTLEAPDELDRDFTQVDAARVGTTHVCRDWSTVWRMSERLEDDFNDMMSQHWDHPILQHVEHTPEHT
ncbi:hypothetical protein EXIGLDRAFT_721174 [Exidia glandulosa HHB12029]|uniref:Uncharacterized protein n=1 Tax=Exidia glandulosa HHB12029 TaxID=1314781 RepID=A0A165FVP6_EXIGL|nr:hypothetical protein EXIGLDRAFT_721174 [Exidia glandulosa HHB12029]